MWLYSTLVIISLSVLLLDSAQYILNDVAAQLPFHQSIPLIMELPLGHKA